MIKVVRPFHHESHLLVNGGTFVSLHQDQDGLHRGRVVVRDRTRVREQAQLAFALALEFSNVGVSVRDTVVRLLRGTYAKRMSSARGRLRRSVAVFDQ